MKDSLRVRWAMARLPEQKDRVIKSMTRADWIDVELDVLCGGIRDGDVKPRELGQAFREIRRLVTERASA